MRANRAGRHPVTVSATGGPPAGQLTRAILVTGGAGFIGSHLVDLLLAEGWRVTVIDNFDPYYAEASKRRNIAQQIEHGQYELVTADICDLDGLKQRVTGPFDAIVHLAARPGVRESLRDPLAAQRINVQGTAAMLELARSLVVPQFVFGSSSSVYGVNPSVPWSEADDVLLPISPYAATKVSGEMLGHVYSSLFDMRFVALRFFTVFGPRQRPDLAIHKFAVKMLRGERIPLFGDGASRRDYTFVADIVGGIRAAIDYDREKYTIVNIGCGRTVTLRDMVEVLESVLGVPAKIDRQPEQPGDVPQTWADITKARKILSYEPTTSLHDGVEAFREWLLAEVAGVR
jgi:UDP-glucuronate 4-epimerase